MINTMAKLFEVAGYKDYKQLPIGEFVKPKKKIYISSIENNKKIKKEVIGLIYKGEAPYGYKVVSSKGIFLATNEHKIFEKNLNKFISCEDAFNLKEFIGLNNENKEEKIIIEKCNEAFSILDLEVEDTHTYFTAGILSHNTFGAGAKALGEFLKKINILCANYNTTLFWISQERVAMGPFAHLPAVTGGEAPKFFASVVNRVTKTDVLKDANGTTGISIRVRNYKNKSGIPFRDANMKLYYSGGFKSDEEYIDFLIAFDLITQKGAYFYIEGEEKSIQGREKLQNWLNEHKDKYEEMKQKVDEMLLTENKLDEGKIEEDESVDMSQIEISEDIVEENSTEDDN